MLEPDAASPSRLRAWIVDRFDQRTYLGLHLTLGLIIAAGGVWAFGALLDAVLDNATLVHWDVASDAWIHARTTPVGMTLSTWVSNAGSPTTMAWLGCAGAVALWIRRERVLCAAWVAAFAGGGVLNRVLKAVVHRTRPTFGDATAAIRSDSFPSGHAMASFIGIGMLVYVLAAHWRAPTIVRRSLFVVAGLFVALVGASRLYLGVHYPSDVLGGYAAAGAWMAICVSGLVIALHRRRTV